MAKRRDEKKNVKAHTELNVVSYLYSQDMQREGGHECRIKKKKSRKRKKK